MKKIIALIFVMAMCSTMFAQQVASGKYLLTASSPGYTLHANSGDRSVTLEVTFAVPFEKKPEIIVTVSQMEASNETRLRYHAIASAISRDGFVLTVKTWGDTKLLSVGGSWIAVSGK